VNKEKSFRKNVFRLPTQKLVFGVGFCFAFTALIGTLISTQASFAQDQSENEKKQSARVKAKLKKRAETQDATAQAVSNNSSIGLKHEAFALPQSEKLLTPKVMPRNMQVVRPPRNSEFYEGSTKEVEYEKLLDKEISDLFQLSQRYRQSKNRGEIWLRLAERYKEKSKLIEFRKQAEYDKELKQYAEQKTKIRPRLDLRVAHDYNLKAIELYEWFIKDFPKDPKIDQALFFLGYHSFEVGRAQIGEGYYKRLVREYPDSDYVVESNFALGEYNFDNEAW